jgi:hypothetical protein
MYNISSVQHAASQIFQGVGAEYVQYLLCIARCSQIFQGVGAARKNHTAQNLLTFGVSTNSLQETCLKGK